MTRKLQHTRRNQQKEMFLEGNLAHVISSIVSPVPRDNLDEEMRLDINMNNIE
ncbi:hypothetical protein ACJX0J_020122, partial [Zea mays]